MDVYGKSNSYAITNIDNINYLVRKNSCGVYGDAYQLGSSSVNFLEYIDDKVIVSGWEDSKGTYMYLFDKNGKSIEKKKALLFIDMMKEFMDIKRIIVLI